MKQAAREKIRDQTTTNKQEYPMDAEHINQIGTQLSNLSVRTEDLRRYL